MQLDSSKFQVEKTPELDLSKFQLDTSKFQTSQQPSRSPMEFLQKTRDIAWDLGKSAWDWGITPLFPQIRPYAQLAASAIPFQGTTERLTGINPAQLGGDFAAEMTSPVNLAATALTGGEFATARAGMVGATRGLNLGSKLLSAPVLAEGVSNLDEAWDTGDTSKYLIGGLETIGGLAGIKAKPMQINWEKAAARAAEGKKLAGIPEAVPKALPIEVIPEPVVKPKITAAEVVEFNKTGRPRTYEEFQKWKLEKETPAGVAEIKPPSKWQLTEKGWVQGEEIPTAPKLPEIPKLPKELTGAKPRYNIGANSHILQFDDDLDKAFMIIAQEKKSARDADYLKFVVDNTGLEPGKARAVGRQVRAEIKNIVKAAPEGSLQEPSLTRIQSLKNVWQRFVKEESGELKLPFGRPENPIAKQWKTVVSALDKNKAPDSTYRQLILQDQSPIGEILRSEKLRKGETWRDKILDTVHILNEQFARESKLTSVLTRTNQKLKANAAVEITPQSEKLMTAIQAAIPVRAEQELMYTAERAERFKKAGQIPVRSEADARKRLSRMAGEYEKVDFEPLKLEQADVDELFAQIGRAKITTDESLKAITGLGKILGEMGGEVPQTSELAILEKVFGTKLIRTMNDAGFVLNPFQEPIKLTREFVNFPRAVMASTDLSAPLRQGIGLIHRKEWWKSWGTMIKSWGSQRIYDEAAEAIKNDALYEVAKKSKLGLTEIGDYAKREELYMSKIAEKLPGVKRSERAYLGFLNKLRFDTFKSLIADAEKAGIRTPLLDRQIAEYINNATGRGSFGTKFEDAAEVLNSVFFSPRLIASRVNMLNPATYVNAPPFVRKQYLKSLFAIAGAGGVVLELAKLAGADVEVNPNSADFGKARFGNVRVDPWGGFQQYLVAAHRLITGEVKSTTTSREFELGERYGTPTKFDIATRFGESKLNPTAGFLITVFLKQKNFQGLPVDAKVELTSRVLPIVAQDLYELSVEDPQLIPGLDVGELNKWLSIGALGGLAGLGMGVQTYQPRLTGSQMMFGDINK